MSSYPHCGRCGQRLTEAATDDVCSSCLAELGRADWLNGSDEPASEANQAGFESDASHPLIEGSSGGFPRNFDDYELLEEIARGGMGVIYQARQVSLNRIVALKLISASALATPVTVKRFRAEAEAAASLAHPNIVPIYEIGQHAGQHYFSMALVAGPSLSERLGGKPMPLRDAAALLATLARAVHYAHQRGVLHRDLKPSNIILDQDGVAHLTDFGLAKMIEKESTLTHTNAVMGTPSYMAPEQASGRAKEVTTSADVYGLGAVLYETLTGNPPFAGGTSVETIRQVLDQEPRRPSSWNPAVDRDLETICLKCLEKEPERRYTSAAALAEDLERWAGSQPILARPVTPLKRVLKWAGRNPIIAGLIVALHIVAACGLAGVLWQWREAVSARRATQEELWRARLLEARSFRHSSDPGRRANALAVLKQAASYRPSVALRNEAIAALALPDVGSDVWWRDPEGATLHLAFSSDLSHCAGRTDDGAIAVWRGAEPEPVAQFPGLGTPAVCMRFSQDDSLLAIRFRDGAVGVWRWQGQELLLKTDSSPEQSHHASIAFTPEGDELWVPGLNEEILRFSLPEGRGLPSPAIDGWAPRLEFDSTGRRLLGWSDRMLTAWDVETGGVLGTWRPPGDVWCVAWHPREEGFAFGTYRAGVHFAEIGQANLTALNTEADARFVFTRIAFTPHGHFLMAGGWGNTFIVWNFATCQPEFHTRSFGFDGLSDDGTRVAGSIDTLGFGVRELLLPAGIRRLRVPGSLGGSGEAAAWHPSGCWFVTVHTAGWMVWNATTGTPVLWQEHPHMRSVQFLPGGHSFLTGGEAGAQLWSFQAEQGTPRVALLRTLTPAAAIPHERAALSPDGKRFAAVGEYAWLGSIAGELPLIPIEQGSRSHNVSFSPDGRWLGLSYALSPLLKIRDAFTGAFVTNLPAGTPGFAFIPTGEHLVTAPLFHDRVTFWRVGSWTREGDVPFGDGRKVGGIMRGFWPNSTCVFTTGPRTTLQLWDLKANAEIATFWLPIDSDGYDVALDATCRRMAVPGARRWVDLWDLAALRRELARLGLDWPGGDAASVDSSGTALKY